MKVLVDNRWEGNTGIGRLYKQVIEAKPVIADVSYIKTKGKLGSPLSPVYLAADLIKSNADVFYTPSFMPPLYSKKPFIITIHDLNHLYYYSRFHKYYFKYFIAELAKKAATIITVSEFTKQQIVLQLGISAKQIIVIYNGVDQAYMLNKEKNIDSRPYFLYVGNRRSYKNVKRMLQAFAGANIPKDYIIKLSGVLDDDINTEITFLGINNRVEFLGNIAESDLPKIYKGAFALLFVSLMEGFGLPVVEAMASGTPVITSNVTSLPEIAGGAALLVNPLSVTDIIKAIETLIENCDIRTELVELGYKRCQQFSWNNTSVQTWDTILQLKNSNFN